MPKQTPPEAVQRENSTQWLCQGPTAGLGVILAASAPSKDRAEALWLEEAETLDRDGRSPALVQEPDRLVAYTNGRHVTWAAPTDDVVQIITAEVAALDAQGAPMARGLELLIRRAPHGAELHDRPYRLP